MTFTRFIPVFLFQRTTRLLGGALSALALASLVACGSSKPAPAPLESLKPEVSLTKVWSQRVGSASGALTLATGSGVVITASTDGAFAAFDAGTGTLRWSGQVKGELSAAIGSDGRHAAVVTDKNELQIFDQGKFVWSQRLPGRVITAPLVAGERVFVQAVDRSVRAYDVFDGRWLWQYQRPGSEPLSLANTGVLSPFRDTLLVGQGSRLVGLDPLRGTVRFDVNVSTPRGTNEVERLADLVGPIARADDEACVRAFQLSVACLELNRGSLRWSRPQSGDQAVAANERLVIGSDDADRLTAWKTGNGDVLWRSDRFTHRKLSSPAIIGDRIALIDGEGYLHLLSVVDGRTLARMELDSAPASAPLVVDQILYVTTRKGTLYALRAN